MRALRQRQAAEAETKRTAACSGVAGSRSGRVEDPGWFPVGTAAPGRRQCETSGRTVPRDPRAGLLAAARQRGGRASFPAALTG